MNTFDEIVQNKSNEELLKMIYEFDTWSPEMLASTESELAKRNILPNDIQLRKQELIELENVNLTKGRSASITGMVVGWLTAFGFWVFLLDIIIAFPK